nr:MAG TPA: hypothetical protein [Caudoviricetes sp.]
MALLRIELNWTLCLYNKIHDKKRLMIVFAYVLLVPHGTLASLVGGISPPKGN